MVKMVQGHPVMEVQQFEGCVSLQGYKQVWLGSGAAQGIRREAIVWDGSQAIH